MELTEEEVADIITYQIGALKGFCDLEGVPLNHVKVSRVNEPPKAFEVAHPVCRADRALLARIFLHDTNISRTERCTFTSKTLGATVLRRTRRSSPSVFLSVSIMCVRVRDVERLAEPVPS